MVYPSKAKYSCFIYVRIDDLNEEKEREKKRETIKTTICGYKRGRDEEDDTLRN